MTLLSEGRTDRGTLLLDDGALVCDRLCGSDVSNKLLDCGRLSKTVHDRGSVALWGNSREVMAAAGTPDGAKTIRERHRKKNGEEQRKERVRDPSDAIWTVAYRRCLGRAGEALLEGRLGGSGALGPSGLAAARHADPPTLRRLRRPVSSRVSGLCDIAPRTRIPVRICSGGLSGT